MKAIFTFFALTLLTAGGAETNQLLQRPTINSDKIVFAFAGDLWSVAKSGGTASRLTTGVGVETDPVFSPDGSEIAFTGEYDGNIDVFVVSANGGVPKRLTYHPGPDFAVGWSPDGKDVIFRSGRQSSSRRYTQLFSVPVSGGLPVALPLPMAFSGNFSADGKRIAYSPTPGGFGFNYVNFVSWRRYRGGLATAIWITSMPELNTTKIPREGSSDFDPVWVGDQVYFLSDRSGPVTIYRYDPKNGTVKDALKNNGRDIGSLSGGLGGLVYDQFGKIFVFDPKSGKSKQVPIEISADFPEVRPRFENVSRQIQNTRISATGMRAVIEAHGEILTVPSTKGDFRNITNTASIMEREPAWSPDGQRIAYFSDESGLYALHIASQTGFGEVKKYPLSNDSTYYFDTQWSPDNKWISFHDNKLNVLCIELASGKLTKIDSDYNWGSSSDSAWSPDSKWLAYTRSLPNRLHALFLYSTESGKTNQITDGMSDVRLPAFDRNGEYLFFTASTNYGPTTSGLDMSSDEHEVTRGVYAAVLSNEGKSPVEPESDEEKPATKKKERRGWS